MYKPNNLILRSTSSVIVFILLGFAFYLLLAGHNSPGGGFVGGLVSAAGLLLMYFAYGEKSVQKVLPINYMFLIPLGLCVATLTGLGSLLFNKPFLTQTFGSIHLPLFGEVEIATAMFFDIGVYLTVLGTTMTIILAVAFDRD